MRRRLFTLLSAASMAVCAAVCAAWVRSHRGSDAVGFERVRVDEVAAEHDAVYAWSQSGSAEFGRWRGRYFEAEVRSSAFAHLTDGWGWFRRDFGFGSFASEKRPRTVWERLGFGAGGEAGPTWDEGGTRVIEASEHRAVTLPYWLLALAASGPPLMWLAGRLGPRWRRRRLGRCPGCGYDLRASPGRCPECGAMPDADGKSVGQ